MIAMLRDCDGWYSKGDTIDLPPPHTPWLGLLCLLCCEVFLVTIHILLCPHPHFHCCRTRNQECGRWGLTLCPLHVSSPCMNYNCLVQTSFESASNRLRRIHTPHEALNCLTLVLFPQQPTVYASALIGRLFMQAICFFNYVQGEGSREVVIRMDL